MKIAAMIQARMGSTRLPGKVLKDIEGRPVLWHVIDRLRRAKLLDQIIVATTTDLRDDALEVFSRDEGIACFRGSEDDVLDRYYRTACHFKVDRIVRITSDCPLIDPEIVDLVIQKHLDSKADYTSNTIVRTYPRGMDTEVFTCQALVRAHREAKLLAEREHVTPYFYSHPELFKLISNEATGDCRGPDVRLCVDTQEDLELVRTIYQELKGKPMGCRDIVALLTSKTELLRINAGIKLKSLRP